MKKIQFAALYLCFFTFSCGKNGNPSPATGSVDKYMSTTTGSTWTYDVITNPGTAGSTVAIDIVSVSGTDTTVEQGTANQRIYRILKHTNGNVSDYYNVTGSDYYRFQTLPLNNVKIQNIYLKDNAPVGTTWSQTVNVTVTGLGVVPIIVANSIVEKGINKTVNGINYNNVITVKTDLSTSLSPGAIISDIKSFYAPKIGLIQGDYKVTVALASVNINIQTLLKTSVIVP